MTRLFFRSVSFVYAAVFVVISALVSGQALAQENLPDPRQLGLQTSVTPTMDSIVAFHDGPLLWITGAITLFVLALMIFVVVRFNKRANPTPNRFSHNTLVEVVWVVVPTVILLVIAGPSFAVLADQMTVPDGVRKYLGANIFSSRKVEVPAAEFTLKVTGYQWYWGYEYVDQEAGFDSILLSEEERIAVKPSQPRLLTVDNELVVPVDTTVRVQVTAADVIHAFAMPAFGVKTDAVPGRLNETWFNVRKTGIYYGQCSELCGKDHAYMPIVIRVVTKQEFADWMVALKAGDVETANLTLAPIN